MNMVTFSAEHLLSYSCETCCARRFKPCVRLGGTDVGFAHRSFCHANRHHKAKKAMRVDIEKLKKRVRDVMDFDTNKLLEKSRLHCETQTD